MMRAYIVSFAQKFLFLSGLAALSCTLHGQGTGALTGSVTDPKGAYVVGAQIRVDGTNATASTDRTGHFTLLGVPVGPHQVTASYLGMDPVSARVEIGADRSTSVDLTLSAGSTVMLGKFEVSSDREGQSRAINLQRSSDQIKNIISADSMGRLPDSSAGEALARIPSISIQSDRGEAEFISVRGLSPKYNNIAINGDRAASATDPTESRQTRTLSLDAVPSDMISGIEVTKTSTADMDADSLGANVNLITKSPLDFKRRIVNGKIEYGMNTLDQRRQPTVSGGFTYGDRYKDGKYGLLVSGSYLDNQRDVNGAEQSYANVAIGGQTVPDVPTNVRFTYRWLHRTRKAISAQGFIRTGADSTHYVRALYNDFADADITWTHRARFDSGAVFLPGTTSTSGSVDGGRITRDDRKSLKSTLVWNVAAGGEWDKPKYHLDYSLTFGRSGYQVNRIQATWEYRLSDYRNAAGVALNADRVPDFTFTRDTAFTYFTDPLNAFAELGRAEIGNRGSILKRTDENHEFATTGVVNLRIPATFWGHPGAWKFGVKARNIERYSNPNAATYNVPAAQRLTLNQYLDSNRNTALWQGRYRIGPSTDVPKFWNDFDANPTRFTFNQAAWDNTNLPTRYMVDETVPAVYGMATTNVGQLRLNGGIRYERTQSKSESHTLNFGPTGAYLGSTRTTSSKSYDDLFPSAVATYRFSDRIMLRGGVTRSTARPDYNQILGGRIIQDDVDRIIEGNPALQPLKATNYDLSFEWYFTSSGMFSAGIFHKDITNFIYSTVSTVTEAPYAGWQLTRPLNGPHSTLTGYELSYSQNFKNLPAPFNGLGFSGNVTRLDGTSVLPTVRGSVDRLIEQPQNVYNVQISYEKFPFSARVACVYNGDYVRGFNATNAALDTWTGELKTYDASINYTLRQGWVFYLQGKNLGNVYSKYAHQGAGRRDLPTELEFVGWTLSSGIKMEF